ncbi:MAG TPA: hypothetical protein DCY40_03420 [Actinobacteria bacterium]|nr:hypothetical protein [Actinomycetota bacterium]
MTTFTTGPADLLGNPRRYDDRMTLAAAEHAIAVYTRPADYGFAAMSAGFEGGTVIERGAAQVGIAWTPEVIVVSPRGSSQVEDWLHNAASVIRRRWRPPVMLGKVGAGFRRQAIHAGETVCEWVEHLIADRPGAQLVIDGHSLGGAMVPLLVAQLAHTRREAVAAGHRPQLPTPRAAFMFCAPRVGNRQWSSWYDERFTYGSTPTWAVVNVVNGEPDLVTRVPRSAWGFWHVGRRAVLTGYPRLDGGPGCEVVFGEGAWETFRAANPVGNLAAWRIISRTVTAARAHFGSGLLRVLRERAGSST